MTPNEWIKLLRENAAELSANVRRLKIGDVEIEFMTAVPEMVMTDDEDEPRTNNDPLKDEWTFSGRNMPVRRSE